METSKQDENLYIIYCTNDGTAYGEYFSSKQACERAKFLAGKNVNRKYVVMVSKYGYESVTKEVETYELDYSGC